MDMIEIVRDLVKLSPRQFERERLTRDYITKKLTDYGIGFVVQDFKVTVPVYAKYYLKADGVNIECLPTSLKAGKIGKDHDLVSSLDFSYEGRGRSNINYNPHSDAISLANFYDAPSLAISRKDADIIRRAKEIDGAVEVRENICRSCNILAGNAEQPKNIIFAHYDCFFEGAIDNASGVAVCLSMMINKRDILKDNLIVFCGAEELSCDKPNYWGKCFGVFEKENRKILQNANKIVIIDCVGTEEPESKNDEMTVSLYYGTNEYNKSKISVLTSVEKNPEKFYRVYHSCLDRIEDVSEKYLQMTADKCISIIE